MSIHAPWRAFRRRRAFFRRRELSRHWGMVDELCVGDEDDGRRRKELSPTPPQRTKMKEGSCSTSLMPSHWPHFRFFVGAPLSNHSSKPSLRSCRRGRAHLTFISPCAQLGRESPPTHAKQRKCPTTEGFLPIKQTRTIETLVTAAGEKCSPKWVARNQSPAVAAYINLASLPLSSLSFLPSSSHLLDFHNNSAQKTASGFLLRALSSVFLLPSLGTPQPLSLVFLTLLLARPLLPSTLFPPPQPCCLSSSPLPSSSLPSFLVSSVSNLSSQIDQPCLPPTAPSLLACVSAGP